MEDQEVVHNVASVPKFVCVCVCVCVCLESLLNKEGGRERVHCTLSQCSENKINGFSSSSLEIKVGR